MKKKQHIIIIVWGDGSEWVRTYTTRKGADAEYDRLIKADKIWHSGEGFTNNFKVKRK
jgi:hypothetical protein